MDWKEAYAKKTGLPYYRVVRRKELMEKGSNECGTTTCDVCNKEISVGEKYFIYWRMMKDPQMIGNDGAPVCIACDNELERAQ